MNILNKKSMTILIVRIFLLIVLFLYTYSTGVNTSAIYSRYAMVMLYIGICLYLFYSFIVKKCKFIKKMSAFDIGVICIVYYVLFLSLMRSKAFSTNLNISIMIFLVYMLIKSFEFSVCELGLDKLINIFEFLFNTFIIFILLSTIVAFFDGLKMFTLFPLPVTTEYKRVQSWFSNSTMYGINISIAIMFSYYNYSNSKNKINLLIILWFIYWMIMTGGRTALIITIIGFIIIFLYKYKIKGLCYLTLFFVGISGSYFSLFDYLTNNFLMFRRFVYGGVGNRDVKMYDVFYIWSEQNPINQILGSGIDSLREIFMYSAHSGFLRLWFDFGVLFVLIYCIFIFFVIKKYIAVIKNTENKVKNLLIIGLALTCMYLVAETMVIITISAVYDFSLLLIILALPYIYSYANKKVFINDI